MIPQCFTYLNTVTLFILDEQFVCHNCFLYIFLQVNVIRRKKVYCLLIVVADLRHLKRTWKNKSPADKPIKDFWIKTIANEVPSNFIKQQQLGKCPDFEETFAVMLNLEHKKSFVFLASRDTNFSNLIYSPHPRRNWFSTFLIQFNVLLILHLTLAFPLFFRRRRDKLETCFKLDEEPESACCYTLH